MKEYKKYLPLLLILLLLLVVGIIIAVVVSNNNSGNTSSDQSSQTSTDNAAEMPELEMADSAKAIAATNTAAKKWAADAKLYECVGMVYSTYQVDDTEFEYVGADSGNYASWMCTYYSKNKKATNIYAFKKGAVDGDSESMPIGQYGNLIYDKVNYPAKVANIVSSTKAYQVAMDNRMVTEGNYVTMRLGKTNKYGYVWRIEETSKTDKNEYDSPLVLRTFIVNQAGKFVGVEDGAIY